MSQYEIARQVSELQTRRIALIAEANQLSRNGSNLHSIQHNRLLASRLEKQASEISEQIHSLRRSSH